MSLLKTIPQLEIKPAENTHTQRRVTIPAEFQEDEELEKWPGKLALFTHIFVTEVITQMITNQLGRVKYKIIKQREDFSQLEYEDE